jgi:hypothetical protein
MKLGRMIGTSVLSLVVLAATGAWATTPPGNGKDILSGKAPVPASAAGVAERLQQGAQASQRPEILSSAVKSPSLSGAEIDTGTVFGMVLDSGGVYGIGFDGTDSILSLYGSWGVADAFTGRYGDSFFIFGYDNLVVDSFTYTPTSAVSVVRVLDPDTEANVFKVTHDFHPALTNNLFECTVTVQNLSPANVDAKYRVENGVWLNNFTESCNLATMKRNGASGLGAANNLGLADPNPLADPTVGFIGPGYPLQNADFVDVGPNIAGAQFNLNLGILAPGQSKTFYLYYGGGWNQMEAMAALAAVGAESYGLAKPNPNGSASCGMPDAPAPKSTDLGIFPGGFPSTGVMGLKGVGGKKIPAPQTFLDDYSRSQLCVAWDPGYYQWSILSGQGSFSQYVGTGQVLNGNAKIASFPGDPAVLNFTYSKLQKKASGYFIDPFKNYSPLTDKLTTDDPPACMPFFGGDN